MIFGLPCTHRKHTFFMELLPVWEGVVRHGDSKNQQLVGASEIIIEDSQPISVKKRSIIITLDMHKPSIHFGLSLYSDISYSKSEFLCKIITTMHAMFILWDNHR